VIAVSAPGPEDSQIWSAIDGCVDDCRTSQPLSCWDMVGSLSMLSCDAAGCIYLLLTRRHHLIHDGLRQPFQTDCNRRVLPLLHECSKISTIQRNPQQVRFRSAVLLTGEDHDSTVFSSISSSAIGATVSHAQQSLPSSFQAKTIHSRSSGDLVRWGGKGPVVVLIHDMRKQRLWAPLAADLMKDHTLWSGPSWNWKSSKPELGMTRRRRPRTFAPCDRTGI